MLRIRRTEVSGVATIHAEGKLLAPWVEELRLVVNAGGTSVQRRLNLAQVTYVDSAGVRLLTALKRAGVEIVACSPFVAELLDPKNPRAPPS